MSWSYKRFIGLHVFALNIDSQGPLTYFTSVQFTIGISECGLIDRYTNL